MIPVILRDVDWEGAPFSHLQAPPDTAKPVTLWRNRDQAFRKYCRRNQKSGQCHKVKPKFIPGLPPDYYFVNHTSFLRNHKQEEFRKKTGVPLDHYDIRVILDSYYEGALDKIKKVEDQKEPIQL